MPYTFTVSMFSVRNTREQKKSKPLLTSCLPNITKCGEKSYDLYHDSIIQVPARQPGDFVRLAAITNNANKTSV